jgi:hypothetical protein
LWSWPPPQGQLSGGTRSLLVPAAPNPQDQNLVGNSSENLTSSKGSLVVLEKQFLKSGLALQETVSSFFFIRMVQIMLEYGTVNYI